MHAHREKISASSARELRQSLRKSPAEGMFAGEEPLCCLTGSPCREKDKGMAKAGAGGTVAVPWRGLGGPAAVGRVWCGSG